MPRTKHKVPESLTKADVEKLLASLDEQKSYSNELEKKNQELLDKLRARDAQIKRYRLLEDQIAATDEQQTRLEDENKTLALEKSLALKREAVTLAHLHEEIATLESAVTEQETLNKKLAQSRQKDKEKLNQLSQEVDLLNQLRQQGDKSAVKTENASLAKITDTAIRENATLLDEIRGLVKARDMAEANVTIMAQHNQTLAQQQSEMQERLLELTHHLHQKSEQPEFTPHLSLEDEMKVTTLEAQVSTLTLALNNQTERASASESKAQDAQLALDAAGQTSQQLRHDMTRIREEQASLSDIITATTATLTEERAQHAKTLKTLQRNLSKAEETSARLEQELAAKQSTLELSESKVQTLDSQLAVFSRENQQLSQALERHQHELVTQRDAATAMQETLANTIAVLEGSKIENHALQEQVDLLQQQNTALIEQTTHLQTELDTKEQTLQAQIALVEAKNAEIERLTALAIQEVDAPLPVLPIQDEALNTFLALLNVSKDKPLLESIANAESNEDLYHDDLALNYVQALTDENAYMVLARAANDRLETLRIERERKRAGYLNPEYKQFLDEDRAYLAQMKQHMDAIHRVDNNIRQELQRLAYVQPIHWFNPGFQSAAKKHATEMAGHFELLAQNAKILLHYLKPLRSELTEQLDSIPTDNAITVAEVDKTQNKVLLERRALLTRYLQKVERELGYYKPVALLLEGNPKADHPFLKQGLLKSLKEAQADKASLKLFPFNSTTEDYAMTERGLHFQNHYVARPRANDATALVQPEAGDPLKYETVPRVPPLQFREHTINSDQPTMGCFIEERASSFHAPTLTEEPGAGSYVPDIKLTINKFPSKANAEQNDPELTKARIEYALAMASQFLAASSSAPSAHWPIILKGNNTEELRYLWTALMVLGKQVPYMKFDHTAIKIQSARFHPKDEMGRIFGFNATSCYKTCFEPHRPLVRELTAGIREVGEHKLGHQKGREATKKAVKTITSMYKTKLDETLSTLKEDQDHQGPLGGH